MEEEERTCETCQHLYRHYVRRSSTKYFPLDVGHCGDPRARYKTAGTPACFRYIRRKEGA